MNQLLITVISALLTAFVLPLLTLAGTRLTAWLNTKIKNEKAAAYMTHATELVMSAVKAVSQTYVDSLKNSGSFTKEAQAEALKKARETVNLMICPDVRDFIERNYSLFDCWLDMQIEAALNTLKQPQKNPL